MLLLTIFLVQQAIKEVGVKINYAQVDQIIENIAAQNGLTYGQLLDVLDYQGIASKPIVTNHQTHNYLMSEVRNRAIGKVDITREEVQALGRKMLKMKRKKKGLQKKSPIWNTKRRPYFVKTQSDVK